MKKLILCLSLVMAFSYHSARAQFFSPIVFDPVVAAKNVIQIANQAKHYVKLVQQLNRMRMQVQYTIRAYRQKLRELKRLPNRDWSTISSIERNLEMVQRSAKDIMYMKQFIKGKYQILYNTYNRLRKIQQNPKVALKMKKKRNKHMAAEANKVIAVSAENIKLTDDSYRMLRKISKQQNRKNLTPMQMRQIQAKTQALTTKQLIELKRIVARQAEFIARKYRMSRGKRLDRRARMKAFNKKFKKANRKFNRSAGSKPESFFPEWSQPNSNK